MQNHANCVRSNPYHGLSFSLLLSLAFVRNPRLLDLHVVKVYIHLYISTPAHFCSHPTSPFRHFFVSFVPILFISRWCFTLFDTLQTQWESRYYEKLDVEWYSTKETTNTYLNLVHHTKRQNSYRYFQFYFSSTKNFSLYILEPANILLIFTSVTLLQNDKNRKQCKSATTRIGMWHHTTDRGARNLWVRMTWARIYSFYRIFGPPQYMSPIYLPVSPVKFTSEYCYTIFITKFLRIFW